MPGAARRPPAPASRRHRCGLRNRYADCSSSGFSRSSLASAGELDPAAFHDVGAVGQPERERRELLDQQHPDPRLGDRADRRDQAVDHDRGEPERQLVDDHEARMGDERLGEHDHLLLAAGQRARRVVEALLELGEQLERALAAGVGLGRSAACRSRRAGSRPTVSSGSSRRPSGTIAMPAPRIRSGRRPAKSASSSSTLPADRLEDPADRQHQAGLAGAVGAEQRGHLAGRDLERHLAHDVAPAARDGQALAGDEHARVPVAHAADLLGAEVGAHDPLVAEHLARSAPRRSACRSRAPRSPRSTTTRGSCRDRPGSPARPCARGSPGSRR